MRIKGLAQGSNSSNQALVITKANINDTSYNNNRLQMNWENMSSNHNIFWDKQKRFNSKIYIIYKGPEFFMMIVDLIKYVVWFDVAVA